MARQELTKQVNILDGGWRKPPGEHRQRVGDQKGVCGASLISVVREGFTKKGTCGFPALIHSLSHSLSLRAFHLSGCLRGVTQGWREAGRAEHVLSRAEV